jgi:shikimate 5-dehydrogenase
MNKARELAIAMNCAFGPLDELSSSAAAIVINATPIGMRGHSEGQSPVPRAVLGGRKIVYDLVYNPPETQFLNDGRAEGCETIGGLAMLVAQAALQFELWTGKPAPIGLMQEAALEWISEELHPRSG